MAEVVTFEVWAGSSQPKSGPGLAGQLKACGPNFGLGPALINVTSTKRKIYITYFFFRLSLML